MTKKFLYSLVPTFALMGGCSSLPLMDEMMGSWVGAPLTEVVIQWGPPTEETQVDGKLIYQWNRSVGLGFSCERILLVNDKSIVERVSYKGNNCPFMEVGQYANWRRNNKRALTSSPVEMNLPLF